MSEYPEPVYDASQLYDFVIIGTGNAALTVGALLAHKGYKIAMLEQNDIPGGYAHSFKKGDFYFCAEVHYVWGCKPGETIYEFLKKVGLHKELTFEQLDPKGYDVMVIPGHKVPIPNGYHNLISVISKEFPEDEIPIKKFTKLCEEILREEWACPDPLPKGKLVTLAHKFPYLLKYRNKTLQDAYDECGLSLNAQTVLAGQAGDYMLPPKEMSFLGYVALFGGYNGGAYYPTKHFKGYIDGLVKFIAKKKGQIFYKQLVTKIHTEGKKVTAVETKDGYVFRGKNIICNMDPQAAAKNLIGIEKFPRSWRKPLQYDYAETGLMIYLGIKGIDLHEYGFGNFNIWHCEENDMNKMWDEQRAHNFEKPWVFLSTPTLHTKAGGTCPEGTQIMEICTMAGYDYFKKLHEEDYNKYLRAKLDLANRLLDLVEEKYIPDLRKHIVIKIIGSPTTNEHFVMAPRGNAYGSAVNTKNVNINRLKAKTPFKNLFWCNASSGYAGIHGTTWTGIKLYEDLTGDKIPVNQDPSFNEHATFKRFLDVMRGK